MSRSTSVCILLGLLLSASTTGCWCLDTKQAVPVVDALATYTTTWDATVNRELRAALVAVAKADQENLRLQLQRIKADARVVIYERTEERISNVTDASLAELERALEGPVSELEARLKEEQKRAAAGVGDREKELELASQLAATLMAHGRESFRLSQEIQEEFRAKRKGILELLKSSPEFSGPELGSPETLADNALATEKKIFDDYTKARLQGFEGLRLFLNTQSAGSLIVEGLGLKGKPLQVLGNLATKFVQAEGQNYLNKFVNKAKAKADNLIKDIERKLNEKP